MKYLLLTLFSLSIFYSCSTGLKVVVDGKVEALPKPPNTVQVGNNLFVDETEISNIDYKEYLYWVNEIHGATAKKYCFA